MSFSTILKNNKLTLPEGSAQHATEIQPDALKTLGTVKNPSPWFEQTATELNFRCPAVGSHTKTSDHPRCELRDLRSFKFDAEAKADPLNVRIMQLEKGGTVIWLQIHDDNEPVFMADYHDGTVKCYWRADDEGPHKSHVMLTDVALGDVMTANLIYKNGKTIEFQVTHNGKKVFYPILMNRKGKNGLLYFKRGLYYTAFVDPKAVAWLQHVATT